MCSPQVNLKMALVQRINACITPLLNTFCYKYAVNITRYKMHGSAKKQLKDTSGAKVLLQWKSFDKMIAHRQEQANRSILFKTESIDHAHRLNQLCSNYGSIAEMYPYTTEHNELYLLTVFRTAHSVQNLSNYIHNHMGSNVVHSVSYVYMYSNLNGVEAETFAPIHKGRLTNPFTERCREQLLSMKNASDQMDFLHNIFKVTDLNLRLRFYTAKQLSYHLSKLFLNVSVLPFGSSVNGFGQEGCDLDLLCKTDTINITGDKPMGLKTLSKRFSITNRAEQQKFLDLVGTIMHKCIPGILDVRKILNARVPIIKFVNKSTNMNCDLSSTNEVALCMSQILFTYGELDNRVKPLVCIIRKWARCKGVTNDVSGHWITNFSLTLLIIFYLQAKNYLPSLHSIMSLIGYSKRASPSHDFSFPKWNDSSANIHTDNLYNLLHGFFEYYSFFNYKDNGICIKQARIKSKPDNSALYIFNPFDAALNVSKNITPMELARIVKCFRDALHILNNENENECISKLLDLKTLVKQTIPNRYLYRKFSSVKQRDSIAEETVRERRIIK